MMLKAGTSNISDAKDGNKLLDSISDIFFATASEEDITAIDQDTRQNMLRDLLRHAKRLTKDAVNVRVINPDKFSDGWMVDHSVVEVIQYDRPFIVDTIIGILRNKNIDIHFLAHPVPAVTRDISGDLIDISAQDNPAAARESWTHIHIDRLPSGAPLHDLKKLIEDTMVELKSVVADWLPMRQCLMLHKNKLEISGRNVSEHLEAAEFLAWLDDRHFTYLGCRNITLARTGDKVMWQIEKGSGLGMLRDDSLHVFEIDGEQFAAGVISNCANNNILITKTDRFSRIHRNVPMDAVIVPQYDTTGTMIGAWLLVGLFSSSSYSRDPKDVPILRRKIGFIVDRMGFSPDGHDGKTLAHILTTYPRDELFQVDGTTFIDHIKGILRLQERNRPALFMRLDFLRRYCSFIIYIPRDNYNARLRIKLSNWLEDICGGKLRDVAIRVDNSRLAQLIMTIGLKRNVTLPAIATLRAGIEEICRGWIAELRKVLGTVHDEEDTLAILHKWEPLLSTAYRESVAPEMAANDIAILALAEEDSRVHLSLFKDNNKIIIRLAQCAKAFDISEIAPALENMGLDIVKVDGPYCLQFTDKPPLFLHGITCRPHHQTDMALSELREVAREALEAVYNRRTDDDAFNALAMISGLNWREVSVLRAFSRYLKQLRIPYSHELMASVLIEHNKITRDLVELFNARHNPDFDIILSAENHQQSYNNIISIERNEKIEALRHKITESIDAVTDIESDRVLRCYLNLIQATLRTNFFQVMADGNPKPWLALKFDCRAIDQIPLPRPMFEVFISSPEMEAVHLRGGKVARGGIRWSDRRDDFRNEILGLMKAQMVKNSVIVPVGSKGGFIVRKPSSSAEEHRTQGIECYKTMMRGLLDITDNRVGDKIIAPPRTVRHDGDDPYLVVAADKGTATFSDIANGISAEYNFWLGDAFASGGSAGYDHKKMGITARGAWEAVKRHFREMNRDIMSTPFSCIGVGDMSGDVFGNGMLLSRHTLLIGAFDHRHIFIDPTPDAASSYEERKRLFCLPRSSWRDYDKSKISKGGAIFDRLSKNVTLTSEIKSVLGIDDDALTPSALITAMLKAPVDLLYFGGIGTYVKAHHETNERVGDRTNDGLRINGRDLRAKVVGEGANLGMTQFGRVEYALNGGRLNTDAIDNSAGVDTSDHEVNIKILFSKALLDGSMTIAERNDLMSKMTDDVTRLVLRDNYRQTQAITLAESRSAEMLPMRAHTIRSLEKTGLLNRAVEFLPDDLEIAERQISGKGLTRPELAVLLAYTKIWMKEELLSSDLPDDPVLHNDLVSYFPRLVRESHISAIKEHALRRDIMATRLANSMINRVGSHFVFAVKERTNADAATIARAYIATRSAFRLHDLWLEIESLDGQITTQTQSDMFLVIKRMMSYAIPWFINVIYRHESLTSVVDHYQDGISRLVELFTNNPDIREGRSINMADTLQQRGVPEQLADKVSLIPSLTVGLDIIEVADDTKCNIETTALIFLNIRNRLKLGSVRERAHNFSGAESYSYREAMESLLESIRANLKSIVSNFIKSHVQQSNISVPGIAHSIGDSLIDGHLHDPMVWIKERSSRAVEKLDDLIRELQVKNALDITDVVHVNGQVEAIKQNTLLRLP